MKVSSREWKRKLVHAGVGLLAPALRWLTWPEAAAAAATALAFNVIVIPRVGRVLYRDSSRRLDPGIVAYPATVLIAILLFRHRLEIAAAVWAMMAFGDPAASIAGTMAGRPPLPWNPKKTWTGSLAYVVVGGLAFRFLYEFVSAGRTPALPWAFVLVIALLAAFLESYPSGLDDNWMPAIPAALLTFAYASGARPVVQLSPGPWIAAGVNAAIALATGVAGVVAPSGAIAGAIVGTIILLFGGWRAYAILWTFFALGTIATKVGYRRKLARGTAQARSGRRGVRHVLANCGMAVVLVLLRRPGPGGLRVDPDTFCLVALAGAFAAALADTLGTEFGSLYGRKAISLVTLRQAAPGTKGAVSLPGTLAGFVGGLAIGTAAAASMRRFDPLLIGAVALAGVIGSAAESLALDASSRRGIALDHEFVNVFNTIVGALVAVELLAVLQHGSFFLPVTPFPRHP